MKRLCRLAAAAFGFSVIVSAASAQGTKLIFTTIASPTAKLGIETYHEWADRINAQGKGIVDIDVRDGSVLANSANFADRLREDVVQISFGSLNYLAGNFQLSVFTALPFILNSAEKPSVVFWRIYKSGALNSEFDEMMPLFIQAYPPNSLHFVKPQPGAIKDLNGLKVLASGKIPTEVVSLLGGAPLSIPLTNSYQALQRGTGDGLYFPFGALQDFKLDEVTHYHIVAPFGGGTGGVWMMKKKYVSLPEAVRKLIDDNSGEAQSRRAGQTPTGFRLRRRTT